MVGGGDVVVGVPVRTPTGIAVDVDGTPVRFESDDAVLAPSSEAVASAFLLPAAVAGRRLRIEGPVTARWMDGAGAVLGVAARWWGYEADPPVVAGGRRTRRWRRPRAVGLCFSAGADSFHALLRGTPRPQVLVTALGYDVPLSERERCRSMDGDVRAVAAAVGAEAVVVRTDLREHPLHRSSSWEHTHGGALAALGHLLAGRIRTLLVSSSYPDEHLQPWGSHPDLDPWWSADVELRHVGTERWRGQKLQELAGEQLVADHLRVCWQVAGEGVNCGRCEKCVRTACELLVAGVLDGFPRLPAASELPARIAALPTAGGSAVVYRRLLTSPAAERVPPAVRSEIERLLVRSDAAP